MPRRRASGGAGSETVREQRRSYGWGHIRSDALVGACVWLVMEKIGRMARDIL